MFAPKTIVSIIDMTMQTNKRNTKVIIVYNHKAMKSITMCHSVYHIVVFLNNCTIYDSEEVTHYSV